jgi:DNA-binding CsgD family transcriptional regulator
MPLSLDRFSDLVGSIYDCTIDPSLWSVTLGEIATELTLTNSVMAVHSLPLEEHAFLAMWGVPDEWAARIHEHGRDTSAVWGGAARFSAFPLDEPMVQSMQTPRESWANNHWFQNWVKPQGIFDAVALRLGGDKTFVGSLAFGRLEVDGEIGEDEVQAIRMLAPHIRRAITISNLLDLKGVLTSTFDALAAGVVLVDPELHVVHANPAAVGLMNHGGPLKIVGGRLSTSIPVSERALANAVEAAAFDEAALGRKGIGIPIRAGEPNPLVIHVLPLKRGSLRPRLARQAVAALFITPSIVEPELPADALQLLYDLTPAETRVLLLIASGMEQTTVAMTLGVSQATVKTHLQHVFDKTGCRRQPELMRLVSSLSAPA